MYGRREEEEEEQKLENTGKTKNMKGAKEKKGMKKNL